MDVAPERPRHPCWICDGSGRANLLAGASARICAMCSGTGMVMSVPSTADEMVTTLLALPGVPRRKLSSEDEARIDAMEEIVRTCIAEMLAEDECAHSSTIF